MVDSIDAPALSQMPEGNQLQWTVVMTKPRQEAIAEKNLQAQHFETYIPLSPRYNRNNYVDGKCPMFPGYCFVGFTSEQSVAVLRSTVGVLSPVKFGGKVTILQRQIIDAICNAEKFINDNVARINIVKGDKVLIQSGPLKGLEALASRIADDRIEVLFKLIGKQQKVMVEANQVKKL